VDQREWLLASLPRSGVHDERVLAAMAKVPRELFVDPELIAQAYEDQPLPIGEGQTISQPTTVALVVQALEIQPGDIALDVGTGSGYQAAVMAECGARVFGIERFPNLAAKAQQLLRDLDYSVQVVVGDGTLGLPDNAPFDAIAVGAAGPKVPAALKQQLKEGGRLVIPVNLYDNEDRMLRVRRAGDKFLTEDMGSFRFVPLIGAEGFSSS
jgi:protein-L-isoaspartate(D-aspartate) O-methyltransferase